MREAHVPAQQPPAQAEARLPRADAYPGGPGDHQDPPVAGPVASVRLIWRVRDRATFRALARAPRCRRGPVTVRAVAGPRADDPPRVAYAVGRSVGSAVARNRLRRRLRAAVHAERCGLARGAAYLVAASPDASHVPFTELRAHLHAALTRAGRTGR